MSFRATLDFLLHDWLRVDTLTQRPRFVEHSRDTFDAVLDTCERIARETFEPANRRADAQEPRFDGERVHLPDSTRTATDAYAASGMLAAAQDAEIGGMQLPCVVEMAANAFFFKGSVAISAYAMLTTGNASLLIAHGTPQQIDSFARHEFSGRWFGSMCLSEPQAGSSLGDVATRARPDGEGSELDPLGPRYRLSGHKMWISGGEHELTENIVHLVLAKIPTDDGTLPAGVKGLSLFVVPKWLVQPGGRLTGERNDVALAGLNHKLGYRGTTNTLLNFGEGRFRPGGAAGAVGYRVGAPGEGLRCMFHMMNEARIGVGLGAVMLGYAGYESSLAYAKQRPQGRPLGAKDAGRPPVAIVEHADVKRMLLAQKAYVEGGLALALYCARLVDDKRSGNATEQAEAGVLLELLTPIAKSWPSEWCLEANSLAIQVLGGSGYTRDFPVEQHWRDNRLNMIHEGTHGIQALDLLGRKVVMEGGKGLRLLAGRIDASIARAGQVVGLAEQGNALARALQHLGAATKAAWASGEPRDALANATPYLQAFGHVALAWMWLELALAARVALDAPAGSSSGAGGAAIYHGKLAAARYFFHYELPKIGAWLAVVETRDATCRDLDPDFL